MIIGTAGHIDHGKTALVKALTGVDTDRLPEEKRRGITVELGFAPITLPGGITAAMIDVPGHEAFVKTMVAGAAGIDVALLVIAADEGIMPQTREHLAILELLEIPSLVVALSKADIVDADWLSLVRDEIASVLSTSRWPAPPIIPCSSLTGAGIEDIRAALSSAGLVAALEPTDIFRLPVDRCFTMKGTGTVVTGTVWSGELTHDSTVRILPGERSARVRQLQQHGTEVVRVGAGERAAVALTGVDVADIPRGSALVTDESWQATSSVDAWVTVVDKEDSRINSRTALRFHLAGADVGASLILSSEAVSGRGGFARIKLDSPIAARGGDRFILRLPSPVGTIGGGIVLDPYPARRTLTAAASSFANAGDPTDPRARFRALVDAPEDGGVQVDSLAVRLGVPAANVNAIVLESGCAVSCGRCFSALSLAAAKARILESLARSEKTLSLEPGVELESAISSADCSRELARFAIAELEKSGEVVVEGSLVRRAGWAPSLTDAYAKKIDSLVHAICAGGKEPPSAVELAERFGGDVPALLRYLEREGRVVQVGADRFYAREAVDSLIESLRNNLEAGAEYGPSQLRETLGFSRKYLIPFLEYCDRAGVTERKGDGRSLKVVRESLTQM